MFGSLIQIQFSVFESNFLWVPQSFLLFGNCIQFLNSNPFIVLMILKSVKMRTPKSCFHFSFSVLIFNFLFIKRSALFLLDSRWTIADEAPPAWIADEATKSTSVDEEATFGVAPQGERPTQLVFFFFHSDLTVSHVLVLLVLVLGLWACRWWVDVSDSGFVKLFSSGFVH